MYSKQKHNNLLIKLKEVDRRKLSLSDKLDPDPAGSEFSLKFSFRPNPDLFFLIRIQPDLDPSKNSHIRPDPDLAFDRSLVKSFIL